MDAINLPVTRNTIRWTNAPVPGRHAGQPETKHVTGRWAGADVDLSLARTNGCQLAQWDSLGPLLPGPGG